MNVRHALASAAALLIPAIGSAQDGERELGWDLGFDVIYQFSQDTDFDGGSSLSVDDDLGLAIGFGYRFNPRLELQFGLDWNSVDYSGVLQSATTPGLGATVTGDMESFIPRVNGVFNFLNGPLTPFIMGGIGWAFIDTNIPAGQVDIGCWWDPWWGQICTPYQPTLSVDEFTYQAGGGVRWDVGDYATLRLAYEKTWIDLSNATSTPSWDQLKLGFAYRY